MSCVSVDAKRACVIYSTATHACATRATPTVCASSQSHRAKPAHEAAQQVVHGAMHEPDGLAVRGEGPLDRAVGSRPARSFVCRRPRLRVDLMEAAAAQCTAADDGRPRCAASSTSPERGARVRDGVRRACAEHDGASVRRQREGAVQHRSRARGSGWSEVRDAAHAARPSWRARHELHAPCGDDRVEGRVQTRAATRRSDVCCAAAGGAWRSSSG